MIAYLWVESHFWTWKLNSITFGVAALFKLAAVNNFPTQLQGLNAATWVENNVVVMGGRWKRVLI